MECINTNCNETEMTTKSELKLFKQDSVDDLLENNAIKLELNCLQIKNNIQKYILEMNKITENMNKMREEASNLEFDLMSIIDCETWVNITHLVGMSSTSMMDQCMKILDQDKVDYQEN